MGSPSARLAVNALCIAACMLCSLLTVVMAASCVPSSLEAIQITHYTHEIQGGPNSTVLLSAGSPAPVGAPASFGSFLVFDNLMKAGPNESNQTLGRIVGHAIGVMKPSSTHDNFTKVQLVMQHIFGDASPYNGSTISVVGLFYFAPPVEMRVLGGTGKLTGYTGYGKIQPISEVADSTQVYIVFRWDIFLSKTEDYSCFVSP